MVDANYQSFVFWKVSGITDCHHGMESVAHLVSSLEGA